MVTQRRKLTLREQIFNEKVKVWSLYNSMQVQKVLEHTSIDEQDDINYSFTKIYKYWGGVEFVNWLRAVCKICRDRNKEIENIIIFNLPKRTASDDYKINNLKVIAKQMGLDVTITKN
jgi:hypothetical protein